MAPYFSSFASTEKIWIVDLSLAQANHFAYMSKHREYMSALSAPLLTSCTGYPLSVEKILMIVPFSLAVANKVPAKLRVIADKEPVCAGILMLLFFSYSLTLTKPLS
jgi:hypothetical protein